MAKQSVAAITGRGRLWVTSVNWLSYKSNLRYQVLAAIDQVFLTSLEQSELEVGLIGKGLKYECQARRAYAGVPRGLTQW